MCPSKEEANFSEKLILRRPVLRELGQWPGLKVTWN
jgi:hypothetical protein